MSLPHHWTTTTSHASRARASTRSALIASCAVLLAACGESPDDSNPTPIADSEVSTTIGTPVASPPPTEPAVTALAPEQLEGDTSVTEAEVSTISGVLTAPAGPVGWALPAGVHVLDTFAPAAEVTSTTDLVVMRASPNAVELAVPDSVGRASLTMLIPAAVLTQNGPAAVPTDLVEFAGTLPNVEVLDDVELDIGENRSVRHVTLTVERPPGAPAFPCLHGDDCVAVFASEASEFVYAAAGRPFHVFVTDLEDRPLVILTQSDEDATDAVVEVATGLLETLRPADGFTRGEGPEFLATAGVRQERLRPGSFRTHLGDTVLGFDLDAGLEDTRLQLVESRAVVAIPAGLGSIAVLRADGFIDPESTGTSPFERTLQDGPTTAPEFETWLRRLVAIDATGATQLAGQDASWWDVTIDPTLGSEPCGPRSASGDGLCIDLIASDVIRYVSDQNSNRLYWIDDAGLVVHATALSPDGIGPLLSAAAPLIDAMTLQPVEST